MCNIHSTINETLYIHWHQFIHCDTIQANYICQKIIMLLTGTYIKMFVDLSNIYHFDFNHQFLLFDIIFIWNWNEQNSRKNIICWKLHHGVTITSLKVLNDVSDKNLWSLWVPFNKPLNVKVLNGGLKENYFIFFCWFDAWSWDNCIYRPVFLE